MTAKSARLHVRLAAEQDELIRRAAAEEGQTITDFAVAATMQRARSVLTDRVLFRLDDAAWAEFTALLDRPPLHKPELEKLLAEEPVWRR